MYHEDSSAVNGGGTSYSALTTTSYALFYTSSSYYAVLSIASCAVLATAWEEPEAQVDESMQISMVWVAESYFVFYRLAC